MRQISGTTKRGKEAASNLNAMRWVILEMLGRMILAAVGVAASNFVAFWVKTKPIIVSLPTTSMASGGVKELGQLIVRGVSGRLGDVGASGQHLAGTGITIQSFCLAFT